MGTKTAAERIRGIAKSWANTWNEEPQAICQGATYVMTNCNFRSRSLSWKQKKKKIHQRWQPKWQWCQGHLKHACYVRKGRWKSCLPSCSYLPLSHTVRRLRKDLLNQQQDGEKIVCVVNRSGLIISANRLIGTSAFLRGTHSLVFLHTGSFRGRFIKNLSPSTSFKFCVLNYLFSCSCWGKQLHCTELQGTKDLR